MAIDLSLYAYVYTHRSISVGTYLHGVGGSTDAVLVMTVFQQTAPDWHGDSPHSELEGEPPGLQGAGAPWLLGRGVLRRRRLAQPHGPQDVERSGHSDPQSPRNNQETVCRLQTGRDSPHCHIKCTLSQIFSQSAVIYAFHQHTEFDCLLLIHVILDETFLHHVLNGASIRICDTFSSIV